MFFLIKPDFLNGLLNGFNFISWERIVVFFFHHIQFFEIKEPGVIPGRNQGRLSSNYSTNF
ncbi:hypothetical protein A33Q_0880 [Indibacter alkaliphilus LW1]|uniref:Uncharacterized protein n=1 Tax=Indibacter alkaliphilus (strain CCUG 57479 / KCTC 22604 / LW1) TaxID=1189612 RepID=S2DIS7_INDAL|nr:hypothetical protein A33Q_0880 [Indibacter alkaliphilus LW1]